MQIIVMLAVRMGNAPAEHYLHLPHLQSCPLHRRPPPLPASTTVSTMEKIHVLSDTLAVGRPVQLPVNTTHTLTWLLPLQYLILTIDLPAAVTDTKMLWQDQFCVATTGVCQPNAVGPKCRQHSQPRYDLLSIILCCPNHLPNGDAMSLHALHPPPPPRATSPISLLPGPPTFSWLLCLPFNFRPLMAKSPFPLYFSMCVVLWCPPNKPAYGGITKPDHWRLLWDHRRLQRHVLWAPLTYPRSERVKPQQLILVVVCFVVCIVVASTF